MTAGEGTAGGAAEGSARRPLSIDDLFAVRWLSDVRLSPDGRRLACVETRCDEALDGVRSRVLVFDIADGGVRSLSPDDASDLGPRWAPDGERLAFIAGRGGRSGVWVAEGEGPGAAVPGVPAGATEIAWHPDGGRLAVAHAAQEADPAGEVVQEVAGLVYKVDGRPFRQRRGGGLAIVTLDGSIVDVSDDPTSRRPAWAPGGDALAWVQGDAADSSSQVADVFVAGPDGQDVRRVTPHDGRVDAFCWSPDGESIAWLGHDKGECLGLTDRVRIMGLDGEDVRDLVVAGEPTFGLTVRSDDGRGTVVDAMLMWVRTADDEERIYTRWADGGRGPLGWVDLDGRLTTTVDGERAVLTFDVDVAAGRIAFVASGPDDPGEVSLCDLDGGAERELSDRNGAWRSRVDFGFTELLDVEAADGQRLEAWLLRPPSGVATEAVPLILSIHGGPHYPIGWRFSFEHHRLAAAGYAVLAGNPRGSAGYGDAFTSAARADWGGIDHADLLAMVDHAVGLPGIDGKRLGVTGVSYGGYMTMWAIGADDRFSVAIAENGISDLISSFGTSHDGGALMGVEFQGSPWERPELYLERSPLRHAERIHTPLLLLHAELDQNCPIGQSEEMFTALRRLGRDVLFVRVPREGHMMNLVGRAHFRRARAAHIDAWLARWLSAG